MHKYVCAYRHVPAASTNSTSSLTEGTKYYTAGTPAWQKNIGQKSKAWQVGGFKMLPPVGYGLYRPSDLLCTVLALRFEVFFRHRGRNNIMIS